jgi:DNA repair protein RadA/Sms
VQALDTPRMATGLAEFDRVLGGGLVGGGVVLIGGDPGIGKSTLLLQALAELSARCRTLYVSGEESAAQIAMRARRLGLNADIPLLTEIRLEAIFAT